MSDPWFRRFKKSGQLTYFNKATAWDAAVGKAIETFNGLGFGCKFVPADDEHSALVVIVLATSAKTTYPYQNRTLSPTDKFNPEELDGHCSKLKDGNPLTIYFACIFLPGKTKGATPGQKEMVVLHELIHAAGMDEHDDRGIMFSHMVPQGDGLIEYLHDKDAKPMPPLRMGSRTRCTVPSLWMDADKFAQVEGCKK